MKRYNKDLGDFGEKCAVEYLKENDYKVLEEKYYTRQGEIDVIALDNDTLAFVEVKTRTSDKFGSPAEAIDNKKIEHMVSTANLYLLKTEFDYEVRFDVIEVYANIIGNELFLSEINHIKGIDID